MNKKSQVRIFVIIIAIVLIILSIGLLIFFLWQSEILFSVIQPVTTNQFTSYSNVPREGNQCDVQHFWTNWNLISSKNAVIPTLLSTFRFETTNHLSKPILSCISIPSGLDITEIFVDEDNCQHWSYTTTRNIDVNCKAFCSSSALFLRNHGYHFSNEYDADGCPIQCKTQVVADQQINDYGGIEQIGSEDGCFYSVKVYKDNDLIDEVDIRENLLQKAYSDNGVVYDGDLPSGESGIEVDFREQSWHVPVCTDDWECQVKHSYRIFVPEGLVTIETSSPKDIYLEGEIVEINIDIENNIDSTLSGELEIKYEVPTIIGTKEKIEIFTDLVINPGSNKFNYSVPTDIRTESLGVTTTIKVYQPTNIYSGINVLSGFEEFGIGRGAITLSDKIRVYTLTEDTKTIRIKSEAESLREEIDLLEGDITALQNLLYEKAQILNKLELTLQEQLAIIDSYELLIDEKAYLISQLELNLQEQSKLVLELTDISEEQAILIDALELSVQEQAQIILEMELTLQEQAIIISNLDLTIQEQANLINNLELNIQEKAQLISDIQLSISEQADLILAMELEIEEQIQIILEMELTVQQQASLINNLDLEIQEQAQIIDNLNLNLAQKIVLISQLELTNQEQIDLISQMELSFSEQQEIIDSLNLLISDDAQQIIDLQLSIIQTAEYINNLELNIQQQADLISQLQLSAGEMGQLISNMNLNIQEQANLINELKQTIEEDAQIIIELNLNLQQQADLISQLDLSNKEMAQLIIQFELTIDEQAVIIDALELTIEEKGQIIAELRLSLEEEAKIINDLELTIQEQIDLIHELNLSLAEEQELVNQLNLTIEEQQQIIDGLENKDKEFNLEDIWNKYKIQITLGASAILLIIILLIVILFAMKRRK